MYTAAVTFQELGLVALAVVAPIVLIVIVMLVRGYNIDLHVDRKPRHRKDDDQG